VKFSPSGEYLATAGATSSVTIYRFPTGQLFHTFRGHEGNTWEVAFSADGTRLVTASNDGTIKLWKMATRELLNTFTVPSGIWAFPGVAYSRDGLIAAAGRDGTITIWNDRDYQEVHSLRGSALWGVAFSPDGHFLAGAYKDRSVRLWDVSAGRELHTFRGHPDLILDLAFSPDGTHLCTSDWDGIAKIWDVSAWTAPPRTESP
jgi:WD40 repeat protein